MTAEGLKNTAGLVKRKNIVADFDADVVSLMKKAGAIILAVTNVSELCMWWESNNNVYGRSRNPYDTRRTVGGSSGGEVILITVNFNQINYPILNFRSHQVNYWTITYLVL